MTVNANVVEKRIVPNGVTFEIDCPGLMAFKESDIVVQQFNELGDVIAIPGYSVTQLGDPDGVKVVSEAPWTADPTGVVVVSRETEPLQQLDYEDFQSKPAEVQEGVPDMLTLLGQENRWRGLRSIRLHPYDEGALDPLPPMPNLLGKVLGITPDGKFTGLENVPVGEAIALSAWGKNFIQQATLSQALDVLAFSALGKSMRGVADTAALVALLGKATLQTELDVFQWRNLGRTIRGLVHSAPGGSANMTVGAGQCLDETGSELMVLPGALTKGVGAWAVGNNQGALDVGAVAPNTTYHRYLMKRPDTGVVDTCMSLSAVAPTVGGANPIPAAYTRFRRIASAKTTGASQWPLLQQVRDRFYIVPVADKSYGGTSALALNVISVPLGIVVEPLLIGRCASVNNTGSSLEVGPANNVGLAYTLWYEANGNAGGTYSQGPITVGPETNVSGQIYIGCSQYSNGVVLYTAGWVDRRGQEAA